MANKNICHFCGSEIIPPRKGFRSSSSGNVICDNCVRIMYQGIQERTKNADKDKKQRKQYVEDAINLVGLNDFKKFLPKQLSGGLLRRLNIACGIAHKPKLIFLDEPTVAVDPQSRNHILDGIKKLRDQGATIVYTTHYMEEVEILCDRIIILDKGKIIAQGTSNELKKEANIEEKIERVGPTLNDVFLKLTGKELRD